MVGPGPTAEQLDRILEIAARTPDHGKLHPWRFVVVSREQRGDLARLLSAALSENDPAATHAHHQKAAEFAHQAETLVVLVFAPVDHGKIPLWEQELSCGAVGMNLLHAAHAMGFLGSWLTGWAAYDPIVSRAFCRPSERIAGFFFFGSSGQPVAERPRPESTSVVRHWQPPAD